MTSKHHLGFMTKNGKTRFVPIERDLMNKLLVLKATKRPSKLLFGTRTGLPDYHMLDTLRSIAKRAGMDNPSRCWSVVGHLRYKLAFEPKGLEIARVRHRRCARLART